jgi:flagellar basal body rod protein FlgG
MVYGMSGVSMSTGIIVGWCLTQMAIGLPVPGKPSPPIYGYIPVPIRITQDPTSIAVPTHAIDGMVPVEPIMPEQIMEAEDRLVPEPVDVSHSGFQLNPKSLRVLAPPALSKSVFQREFTHPLFTHTPTEAENIPPLWNQQTSTDQQSISTKSHVPNTLPLDHKTDLATLFLESFQSEEERSIWRDELQGMTPEQIEELLKFRRQSRTNTKTNDGVVHAVPVTKSQALPMITLEFDNSNHVVKPGILSEHDMLDGMLPDSDLLPQITPDSSQDSETLKFSPKTALEPWQKESIARLEEMIECLKQAATLHSYNLANAHTPWFHRAQPRIVSNGMAGIEMRASESSPHPKISADQGPLFQLETDPTEGPLAPSNHSCDIALEGPGYLQICDPEIEDAIFYVRGGRLVIDPQQRLCVQIGAHPEMLPVLPQIVLNQPLEQYTISAHGEIKLQQLAQDTNEAEAPHEAILTFAFASQLPVLAELEPGLWVDAAEVDKILDPTEPTSTNNPNASAEMPADEPLEDTEQSTKPVPAETMQAQPLPFDIAPISFTEEASTGKSNSGEIPPPEMPTENKTGNPAAEVDPVPEIEVDTPLMDENEYIIPESPPLEKSPSTTPIKTGSSTPIILHTRMIRASAVNFQDETQKLREVLEQIQSLTQTIEQIKSSSLAP